MQRIVNHIVTLIAGVCIYASVLAHYSPINFTENKGQWHPNVELRLDLPAGYLYLEQTRFTYLFYDEAVLETLHAHATPQPLEAVNAHAFHVNFLRSNPNAEIKTLGPTTDYKNFYLGNDPSRWATRVNSYKNVIYKDIYSKTDLSIYGKGQQLKYDFVVYPGGDPDMVQMEYSGVEDIALQQGNLHVKTTVNEMMEQQPYAFQIIEGNKVEVPCQFNLEDNVVSFVFPEGYNDDYPLVIDPVLSFSSFTGSTASNFGFTATYDDTGHMYIGGIVFAVGLYPTSTGAFQLNFNSGIVDMGISKFTVDGSGLDYSTYLGGSQNESPHSLVVNSNDELLILGTTGSDDFPTSLNGYNTVFNGGTNITFTTGYGFNHVNGTDIVISKLSADGTALLGSTYVGGTGSDGMNLADTLAYNYGDPFRGEIIVDDSDNCYVASSTMSNDFPVTGNAPQNMFGGGNQDGVVFKLSPDLSALLWSTYAGGNNDDTGFSVQLDSNNDIYICGGTRSTDLPTTPGAINPTLQGAIDGYIIHYPASGNGITAATYIGTASYDQCYFIQLDVTDSVYVVGQTTGNYPISNGVYNNPNSGQFIHKLDNTLSTTDFTTTIGTGSGQIDFSTSAFLVSDCGQIYVSGWGGSVNQANGIADFSTTIGLPTTANAFQSATDGSDFYLIVLDENATALVYATFFGGPVSAEHVDGGTSRFDKNGIVYQAVCAGCGGNSDFPTTPGVWSNTNQSTNCNLGAFKFDLAELTADVNLSAPYTCLPDSTYFINLTNGGTDFFWDFGDNTTSIEYEPVHMYQDTGVYHVMLVASDSLSCTLTDTAWYTITVYAPNTALIQPIDTICPEDSVQLFASGGDTYLWSPTTGLSDSTIADPWASPGVTTTYIVQTTDSCGTDADTITVHVYNEQISIIPDTSICLGNSVSLYATGGGSYSWTASVGVVPSPNSPTPMVTPLVTTTYYVEVTTPNGCLQTDSVTVTVDPSVPVTTISSDTIICNGASVTLNATGGNSYSWTPSATLNDNTSSNPIATPTQTTTYIVEYFNSCGSVFDSVTVTLSVVNAVCSPDVMICQQDSIELWATGGESYWWSPGTYLSDPDTSHPISFPAQPITYMVVVYDSLGCTDTSYTSIGFFDDPYVYAGADDVITWGSSTQLNASGSGTNFSWSPADSLSCTNCSNPIASPTATTTYVLTLTDANGCTATDSVTIVVDGSLYVPNTFTPNGDGINDMFFAFGQEIETFEMWIFNRWGELIFTCDDLSIGWDGTYQGDVVQIDTYVWRIKYKEYAGKEGERIGHVNVVR